MACSPKLATVFVIMPEAVIGGALLAVIGVIVQWRQDRAGAVIVLLWFVLPFVFLANTKIVVPRHLISAVIVLAIWGALEKRKG